MIYRPPLLCLRTHSIKIFITIRLRCSHLMGRLFMIGIDGKTYISKAFVLETSTLKLNCVPCCKIYFRIPFKFRISKCCTLISTIMSLSAFYFNWLVHHDCFVGPKHFFKNILYFNLAITAEDSPLLEVFDFQYAWQLVACFHQELETFIRSSVLLPIGRLLRSFLFKGQRKPLFTFLWRKLSQLFLLTSNKPPRVHIMCAMSGV